MLLATLRNGLPFAVSVRRTKTFLLVAGVAFLAIGGVARADGAIPNCIHYSNLTSLSIALPQNDPRTAGGSQAAWLYRWDGSAWRYTNRSVQARAYAGGIWYDNAGSMVSSMQFTLQRNSGYYLLKQQVVGPRGDSVVYWASYYQNYYGASAYTSYCTA
jgi:hypothetical protein